MLSLSFDWESTCFVAGDYHNNQEMVWTSSEIVNEC